MACAIHETTAGKAIFACTTSGWAFGPVMPSPQHAEAYETWLREERMYDDPRDVYATHGDRGDNIMEQLYGDWYRTHVDPVTGDLLPAPTR